MGGGSEYGALRAKRGKATVKPPVAGAAGAALLAALCLVLLAAACGSAPTGSPASPAAGAHAGNAQSAASASVSAPGASGPATRYLAIARAGNKRLETDFDGLREAENGDLAAAAADLRDAAVTERLFDRRLSDMTLPPRAAATVRLLVTANESRAQLADVAAGSPSLAQLRGYEPALAAANASVEEAVRVIRSMLGLPPPETS
jgi:hypothetical protein